MGLLWVGACGEPPEPIWLLGEEPRVLAVRSEVVEAGPVSSDFAPIPADRVRSQPLPGDVVEVSAWVFAAAREVPTAQLEPLWFLCPRDESCVESLARPSATEPCPGVVPVGAACRLGTGERPRFVAPALDPSLPLEDQLYFVIAMVGHVGPDRTTADCIDTVSDPSAQDWAGCIVGYRGVSLGPIARLFTHALDVGVDVPSGVDRFEGEPVVPTFNPEVAPFTLAPFHGPGQVDMSRAVRVEPGGAVTLEADTVYLSWNYWDGKDLQKVLEVDPSGSAMPVTSVPSRSLFTTEPGLLELTSDDDWLVWTPSSAGSFAIHQVLYDSAGGMAWGTYDVEVASP